MAAFAANSVLCRIALRDTAIDPASFTSLRLVSGALVLWLLTVRHRHGATSGGGSWRSALALFAYAALFSFAYVSLPAGTGALLLFGAVQATMVLGGILAGERLRARQWTGLLMACGGLVTLVLPGVTAPSWWGAAFMLGAGVAWGAYSLRGRGIADPTRATAGNFARSVPFALALSLALVTTASWDARGVAYALVSGAVTSGLGYVVWYSALRGMRASTAAVVQLSVPVLAAAGGVALLGESLTSRLVVAAIAILGGIALVVRRPEASIDRR